jgi:hypothetical protein
MSDIYVTWNEAKMIMTCIYLLRNKYSSNLEIQYINKTFIPFDYNHDDLLVVFMETKLETEVLLMYHIRFEFNVLRND